MNTTKYESIEKPAVNEVSNEDQTSVCSSSYKSYKIRRWLGIRRSTWLLSLYIVAYFTYLVGGCTLFTCIEQDVEEEIKTDIDYRKREFIARHPGLAAEDLEQLIDDIMYRGISPKRKDFNNSNWSFGQSFLFTVTVVTTIGYGHIHPMTPTGKMACIMYAVIGIPFTLIFLSAIVQRLLAPTFKLLSSFIRKLPHMDNFQVRLIHLALMGSVFLVFSILIPSVLFYVLEPEWTILDALYFVFISLTTIGLGDYIPGDSPPHLPYKDLYKTCVGLFLLFGLILTSLTLTVFYDIPQLNLGLHLHRHRDISEDGYEEKIPPSECQSMSSTQTH